MTVSYKEHAVPAALRRFVECAWSLSAPSGVSGYPVRPDGCLDILFSPGEGARAIGAMTSQQRFNYEAGTRIAGVRFRPGMAGPFLRVAPAELTDTVVPLEGLWGRAGREMAARLHEARSTDEFIARMTAGFPAVSTPPSGVQRAIEAITAAQGVVDLESIARQANLSPRQFRRRCLEESGLTPKHLCRVLRFRHALSLAAGHGRPEWSGIAADAGYFDQAHLIRDFREFTGQTPMAVFSKTGGGVPG